MASILILGGYGFTGKRLAHHLLAQSSARLALGGRNIEKARADAEQFNAEFPGGRVTAVAVDAADADSLREALRAADLLLVAAPTTRHAETVIRGALVAGVDYLDVQLGERKLTILQSLAPEIQRAGRCFITEAGFHPGLPAAMVRFAATRLDRIESALVACYLNMGPSMPYSEAVDELMEAFQEYRNDTFADGRWRKSGLLTTRNVRFGSGVGVRQCYPMYFAEMQALPEQYPSLTDLGFYISGSHWLVDWLITPLAIAGLKMAPRLAMRPMGKLVWWGMQTFPRPPYLVQLKVEASGVRNGKAATLAAAVSHPDGYELTAIPVVACLLQYLDGSIRQPGLWMMGHLAEPVQLLRDMERMGLEVTTALS